MQHLAELCAIIIENNLGELAAVCQIFTKLAEYGRATQFTLRSLTGIPSFRLQPGLAILIQYHIVLYAEDDNTNQTFYQVDWHAAYVLVRTDKIQRLVGERHGEDAGRLIDNVLQLGLVAVGDLVEQNNSVPASDGKSTAHGAHSDQANGSVQPNGIEEEAADSRVEVQQTLQSLLDHGFLIKVVDRSFMPHADLQQYMQDTVVSENFPDGKITGPKKQKEFKAALNVLKRKWQEEDDLIPFVGGTHNRAKRVKIDSAANKHSKLNGNVQNELDGRSGSAVEANGPELQSDMIVRVNYNKCIMALRTQRLERTAKRYLGGLTAVVYGALLRVLERKERAARDIYNIDDDLSDEDENDDNDEGEYDSDGSLEQTSRRWLKPSLHVYDWEVMENLDDSIDLSIPAKVTESQQKLERSSKQNGDVSGEHNAATANGINGEEISGSEDDEEDAINTHKRRNRRLALVGMHLELLAEHSKGFCIRIGKDRSTVDIGALTNSLIRDELDVMIEARHDYVARRIVRILREKGKLEEKQIAYMSLKRLKDVRQILSNLQAQALVDVQELPKDATRQPNRNTYLWFFDEDRVSNMFLQHIYQGMSRLFQRIQVERKSDMYRTAVDKAERVEVRGREQELLAPFERELVKKWRDTEERMMGQISRLDDTIALLRDFSGKDTTLDT